MSPEKKEEIMNQWLAKKQLENQLRQHLVNQALHRMEVEKFENQLERNELK
jgi:hypothetical protein